MAEKAEDLKLPLSTVGRRVKEALPDGAVVSKEARTALARAASVFVLHATNLANASAQNANRKTVGAQDVLAAIKELECDQLLEPVEECLLQWRADQAAKKKRKAPDDGDGAPAASVLAPEKENREGDEEVIP